MSIPLLNRRPSSGLGNVRESMADPARNIDWILMGCVIALNIFGAFIVYSASRPQLTRLGLDPYSTVQRQIAFLIISAVAMILTMTIDFQLLRGRAEFLYGATLVLLVLVLIVGAVRGGARLSFDLGFFSVQPAEMAKVTTLLMLAGYLSDDRLDYVPYDTFINALLIMVAPSVLILLQPDLGSAAVLVACAMGVLLVAGVRIKYIVMISLFALISGVVAILSGLVRGYQLDRFKAFINQNSDDDALQNIIFQVKNAKRAVASGGLFGKGYLQGPLTNGSFIPVQKTDFVFSAIAEQFGLIGSAMVLTLFGTILWRIWRTAQMTRSQLGRFICIGAFTMILWQVFQNIGMTLGIMPVTGFALPYVSYGGSHIVAGAVLIGLVQNVHMRRLR